MPDAAHLSDQVVRAISSGAIGIAFGIGLAAVLLVALRILLPPKDRKKLRAPVVLVALHVACLGLRWPLDPATSAHRTLSVASLFLLLTALGRGAFLLVVDVVVGLRLGKPLPRIIHDIVQGVVFAFVALVTLRAAGVEPGSLLTTSALLTAVVGFSLQDPLGNLFAGLSIQAQRPFEVGDWIQIEPEAKLAGRVVEINWRATKVVTNDLVELTIPNGTLARATIRNYSKPAHVVRRSVEVQGPYDVSPRRVEAALIQAVRGVPGVLREPDPFVLTAKFDGSGIAYQLFYFIEDFAARDRIDSGVRQRVWFSFERAGIAMPFSTHTVQMADTSAEAKARAGAEQQARRREALRNVDFLTSLPEPLLDKLASLSATCLYMIGETILSQGIPGHELYVIVAGEVSVLIGREGGSVAEVARLGPGKFFGEMSLMTGEPRTATIQATTDCELVKVDKHAFHEILVASPGLAERITEVLVARQAAIEENVASRRARAAAEMAANTTALLGKIRQFFAL